MKRRALILIALVVVVASAIWIAVQPTEPRWRGQPLSFWFTDEGDQRTNFDLAKIPSWAKLEEGHTRQFASVLAVAETGTNSIPTLLKLLRSKDSNFKLKLIALAENQKFHKFQFTEDRMLNMRASLGFKVLGAAGSNAVPALIELVEHPVSEFSCICAMGSLRFMGIAASNAVPAVFKLTKDSHSSLRIEAAHTLESIDPRIARPRGGFR